MNIVKDVFGFVTVMTISCLVFLMGRRTGIDVGINETNSNSHILDSLIFWSAAHDSPTIRTDLLWDAQHATNIYYKIHPHVDPDTIISNSEGGHYVWPGGYPPIRDSTKGK